MPFYYVKSRVTNVNDHSHIRSRLSSIGLFVNVPIHYQPLLPTAINTATTDVFKSGTHLVIILHLFYEIVRDQRVVIFEAIKEFQSFNK